MSKREYIIRYLSIIKKLRSCKIATFDDIRNYLEHESEISGYNLVISKRTFHRDLDEIRSIFNVDIQFDFSRKVYFIGEDEEQMEMNNRILEAFDLINTVNLASGLSSIIHFEKRKPQGTDHFYGLLYAIKNRFMIRFSHQKYYEDESSIRVVEPYALKESQHRWYLVAKDKKDNAIKTFGLDRITGLEITCRRFVKPKDLDIESKFRHSFGIITDDENDPEEIILSFDPEQGRYLKSFPLHRSQEIVMEKDDEIRILLRIHITYDFLKEILSWGESVKVIKPKSLIIKLKKSYETTLAQYISC